MKNLSLLTLMISLFIAQSCTQNPNMEKQADHASSNDTTKERPAYAIVIHGGAGTILKENMTPKLEKEYLDALNEALDIGQSILQNGFSSLAAVEEAILVLENSPLFNAGKGAVFTNAGINELDASIMNGADLNAGAVGGLTIIKNPIKAAIQVMQNSEHVMLTGAGAEQFAIERGLDTVSNDYFFTQKRWDSLQKIKAKEKEKVGKVFPSAIDTKFGTVGCVALDVKGNIVAGTSTGGMTNKRYNRIGDSPIIGAGTYANNATCGVSSTGHGEFFIRYAVAHDISALMEYKNYSLQEAADWVIHEKLKKAGGAGGIIALDKNGNIAMPFNTKGMYRGYATPTERVVKIYED